MIVVRIDLATNSYPFMSIEWDSLVNITIDKLNSADANVVANCTVKTTEKYFLIKIFLLIWVDF